MDHQTGYYDVVGAVRRVEGGQPGEDTASATREEDEGEGVVAAPVL